MTGSIVITITRSKEAHLSDINNSVILWYVIWNDSGTYIKFDYLPKHPDDNYRSILHDIYNRNGDGFNFGEDVMDYFINSKKVINEKYIFNFKSFLSSWLSID